MSSASDSDTDASSAPTCWDHLGYTLENIKSIGDFATRRAYPLAPNPVLQVGGDIIPLPLHDRDAQSIKKLARQAPFGKGDQTLVDVTVRRTWEVNISDFRIMNPSWPSFIDTLLKHACDNLGIVEPVDAQPHKLLLYEQDSFFKPHKDSQKAEGMVATLAICLPSEHEGGEVHLSHAGQHRTFDTSESSLFDTTALAWYSDVTHEVRKVVSGHRLVLTYNIIHTSGPELSAGAFDQQLDTLDRALTQCRLHDTSFARKIYPLDHKYSRAGLSLRDLKGRDRAVCQSLYKLCSRHGFYLLLSHVTKVHSSYPDEYDDENDEVRLSLDVINGPDGAQLAKEIAFLEDQLIVDPYSERVEDSFEESEHLGNEESPEIFKYYDTVSPTISPEQHRKFLTDMSYAIGRHHLSQDPSSIISTLTSKHQHGKHDCNDHTRPRRKPQRYRRPRRFFSRTGKDSGISVSACSLQLQSDGSHQREGDGMGLGTRLPKFVLQICLVFHD